MLRIQLLFSTVALFVRTELLCSPIRKLPPNRAVGVAVLECSPIRYNRPNLSTLNDYDPIMNKQKTFDKV